MSRLFTLLAVCCLSLGLMAPAASAADTFTKTDLDIPVVDGPNDDKNVLIDGDLYVPNSLADPAPVVINAHGFGGSKATNDNGMNEVLANAGYIVYAYSSRGFGATTGRIGLDGVDYDVKDVQQIIDKLATLPKVQLDGPGDPRLGMVGPSYGGGIQLQVAGVDDRLDVIVPFITWHSLVSSLSPNYLNTDLRLQEGRPIGVFKQDWTTLFYSLGNAQPIVSPEGSAVPPDGPCPGFVDPLCQLYTESLALGRATPATVEILRDSSPATAPRLGNIDIPTLLVQGQADTLFTPNEATANYTAIKANGAPVKMIWHNGGHGGYAYAKGELELLQQRVRAWFDHHLSGNTSIDTGPGFEYFRDWKSGGIADRYGRAGSYPAAKPTTLFLSGDGALATSRSAAKSGAVTFVSDPATVSYSETSNFQNQQPFSEIPASDPPGTFAAFTTSPLARDTAVVGIPTVRFPLSSTIGEAQLFAKIYDVAADGSTTLIRRMVAPIRATELGDLEAQLVGFAHEFAKGHSIRLVLASTDAAYGNLRTPTGYTMDIKAGQATLTLPLLGADTVRTKPRGNGPDIGGGDIPGGGGVAGEGDGRGGPAGDGATLPATGGGAPSAVIGLLLLGVAVLVRRRLAPAA